MLYFLLTKNVYFLIKLANKDLELTFLLGLLIADVQFHIQSKIVIAIAFQIYFIAIKNQISNLKSIKSKKGGDRRPSFYIQISINKQHTKRNIQYARIKMLQAIHTSYHKYSRSATNTSTNNENRITECNEKTKTFICIIK